MRSGTANTIENEIPLSCQNGPHEHSIAVLVRTLLSCLSVLLCGVCQPTQAQEASAGVNSFTKEDFVPASRGGRLLLRLDQQGQVELYKDSYALVIGNGEYRNGWSRLPGVSEDVLAVRDVLRTHGFKVGVVQNVTRDQTDRVFTEFINRYGMNPDNRLLIYYAGHGHTQKSSYGEEIGYLVPIEAPDPNKDPSGFLRAAIPMSQLEVYAKQIQAKHALFLFDSCFSGTIFTSMRAAPPPSIRYQMSRPVRQFITSGDANESVPDKSIFRRQFVSALQGEADTSRDGYVTGEELGRFLQDSVMNYTRAAQHPQYGKLRHPDLDKGDVVFELTPAHAAKVTAPESKGTLFLNAQPPALIRINGKDAATSPIESLQLHPGTHILTFVPRTGAPLKHELQLRSDEVVRCIADFDVQEVQCRSTVK